MNIHILLIASLLLPVTNGLQSGEKQVIHTRYYDGTTMSGIPAYQEWLATRSAQGKAIVTIVNTMNYQNNNINNKEIYKK